MSNDNALMGEPLSEAEDAAARIRAYLDACSGANSFGREIRWELSDADGRPYNLPRADLVAVLDGLAAEAKDCEILKEGYINAMDDYGNQLTEVAELRARVGVLQGQLATAREEIAEWRKVAAEQTRMERARADEAHVLASRIQERLTAAQAEGLGEESDDV